MQVRWAFTAGLCVAVLLVPINHLISRAIVRASVTLLRAKDARISGNCAHSAHVWHNTCMLMCVAQHLHAHVWHNTCKLMCVAQHLHAHVCVAQHLHTHVWHNTCMLMCGTTPACSCVWHNTCMLMCVWQNTCMLVCVAQHLHAHVWHNTYMLACGTIPACSRVWHNTCMLMCVAQYLHAGLCLPEGHTDHEVWCFDCGRWSSELRADRTEHRGPQVAYIATQSCK